MSENSLTDDSMEFFKELKSSSQIFNFENRYIPFNLHIILVVRVLQL